MSVNTGSSSSSNPGRDGGGRPATSSVLAPSKFSSNFLTSGSGASVSSVFGGGNTSSLSSSGPFGAKSETTNSFPGFKASKLSSVTGTLFGGSSTDIKTTTSTTPSPWTPHGTEASAEQEKKTAITFLPLQPKAANVTEDASSTSTIKDDDDKEDTENSDHAKTATSGISPAKRSPSKVTSGDEDTSPTKRVRLEVAPPPATSTTQDSPSKTASTVEDKTETKRSLSPPLTTTSASESSGFVFGQNLTDRADNFSKEKSESFVFGQNLTERADNFSKGKSDGFVFGQNLTARAENFSPEPAKDTDSASTAPFAEAKPSVSSPAAASSTSDPKSPPKSLSESAAAYYESHAPPKRKYDEVVVVTGEEGEVNVVQMSAKLHWFDKASGNWTERGRGILRLNDIAEVNAKMSAPPSSSRLVMRTSGSLRVILNTKLYRGMPVECPSEKNLRLTGMDDSGILRVFLVTGATKDISNMFAALQFRLAAIEKAAKETKVSDVVSAGEGSRGGAGSNGSDNEDSDSDDDCGSKLKAPRLT